jgi:Sec-independent protein translocase protein TatA
MTLGALIAIAVIVLGAMQLPRLFKAKAGGAEQAAQLAASTATNSSSPAAQPANASTNPQQPPPPVSEPAPPSEALASQGATTAGQTAQPAEQLQGSNNPTPPAGSKKRLARASQGENTAHNGQINQVGGRAGQAPEEAAASPSGAGQAAPAPAGDAQAAKELEELEDQMTSLAGRANAMKDSVENLRQRQASAGYSLRPDISASLSRMEQYMGKADAALNSRNPEAAKKYMDLAEQETEKLEEFFGR